MMDLKELEAEVRKIRFELDLLEERQNQWIEKVKRLLDSKNLGIRERDILEEEDGPQPF